MPKANPNEDKQDLDDKLSKSSKPVGKGDGEDNHSESECEAVKLWQSRIGESKKHFMPDFKRMKKNMNFACGYQRPGQRKLDTDKYVNNITLRVLLEKMAALYARNPKAEWQRRERLDFQLWDGKIQSLQQAAGQIQMSALGGMPPPPQAVALMLDVVNGHKLQDMAERVGKTVQAVYTWNMLEQEPDFKESMKDLVLRACVCGVGYVRISFERDFTSSMPSSDHHSQIGDRAKRIQHIMELIKEDKITEESPQMEELAQLIQSMTQSIAAGEIQDLSERIIFDFPEATSIIVDRRCRNLKTFEGARWVVQEYLKPLEEVNEFFESDIPPGGELKHYDETGRELATPDTDKKDGNRSPMICLWEIFDLRTKSTLFIADGYKYYVQKPQAVNPTTRRFWPIFGLVFNKVIVEPGIDATCYPPSDVDLMRHPQKEWNRSREELRQHRKANAPLYLVHADKLTKDDKDKLNDHEANEVIEIQASPDQSLADMVVVMKHDPIQPALYDTTPLEHDILLAVGSQQADIGPVARTTATESSIAEHAKMSTTSSNIDELDDLLSGLAKSGGEIILREYSLESVKRIAGVGAVFPTENREDFINEIFLDTKAASSGRPNKALEVSNAQIIMPLLLQAGANPAGIVEELVRRLDDQLEVERFLPLIPPSPGPTPGPGAPGKKPNKSNGPPPGGRPPMQGPRPQQALPSSR